MNIEVWSDFVCPFCYIGKRRLELALEQFPNKEDVTVAYKSYELDPNAEENPGKSIHELLAAKYGMSVEKAKKSNEEMGKQAAELGLIYHFDSMKHTNTFDAHRVAQYAKDKGKGNQVTERLLKAYFTDSELISNHDTLARLAGEAGLNQEDVRAMLETDDYKRHVRADEQEAGQLGVEGVPFLFSITNMEYPVHSRRKCF